MNNFIITTPWTFICFLLLIICGCGRTILVSQTTLNKYSEQSSQHKITSTLSSIYEEEVLNYNWDKCVFAITILEIDNKQEMRVAIFHQVELVLYLENVKEKPLGFFYQDSDSIPVFLFGKRSLSYFSKENESNVFLFLKKNKLPTKRKTAQIPEPYNLEPTVWIYALNDVELLFIEKGFFRFLE